jgi:hypothetical protein
MRVLSRFTFPIFIVPMTIESSTICSPAFALMLGKPIFSMIDRRSKVSAVYSCMTSNRILSHMLLALASSALAL